jgi:hypothetical protein
MKGMKKRKEKKEKEKEKEIRFNSGGHSPLYKGFL